MCRLWERSCIVANNFLLGECGVAFGLYRDKKVKNYPTNDYWFEELKGTSYFLLHYICFSLFFSQLKLTILAMREIQTITLTTAHVTQAVLIHTVTCSSSSCPVKQRKSRYTEIYTGLTRPDIWQGTRPKCEKIGWLPKSEMYRFYYSLVCLAQ